MEEVCRSASKRLSETARHRAEQFDSTILHNHVADLLAEDDELRRLVDLAERSYDLAAEVSDESLDTTVFGAAEDLNEAAEQRVDERVTELVAGLDDETLDEWRDTWDSRAIQNAREEREEFLEGDHSE